MDAVLKKKSVKRLILGGRIRAYILSLRKI
jgi:hypothetical protein